MRLCPGLLILPIRFFALMKSMNIAASGELVSRLSTHRKVVTLDSTDFTDVAAVVITVADSRSGILALLKRAGFHIPVFIFSETNVDIPADVEAVICGNDRQIGALDDQ
jgi:ornithine decarboxylase